MKRTRSHHVQAVCSREPVGTRIDGAGRCGAGRIGVRRPARWPVPLLAGLLAAALVPAAARAEGPEELRSVAARVAEDVQARKKAGQFDAAAQRDAVKRLSEPALGFVEYSDRAALAGRGTKGAGADRLAYEAISGPLGDIYRTNSAAIEAGVQKIIEEDGDLEALYESASFQESQSIAANALYLLNWLHFYGARLYEGKERRQLLETARRGFSEFAVGDRRSELLTESLLGRGLCHLELGELDSAIHDLKLVADDAQAAAERRAKARLALLDAYVRAGNTDAALKLSDRLLAERGSHGNWVRFMRTRMLLDAAKRSSGAAAAQYRQRALTEMDRLRRAGGAWEQRVAALLHSEMENPAEWAAKADTPFAKWEVARRLAAAGDYERAAPLLEEVVGSEDASVQAHRGEAHYLLGLARFRAGNYEGAATELDAALQQDEAPHAADASYMRFKSLEALIAENWDAEVEPRYEKAVREFLADHADHRAAYEARFRLAELLQARGAFEKAIEEYGKVTGDAGFELQARFGTLQCRFELFKGAAEERRAQVVQEIGADLQNFDAGAAALQKQGTGSQDLPLQPMFAKVAIMRAVHANLLPTPDGEAVVKALGGFEESYPEQQELLPQVVRLRLVAFRELGRFAEAEAEVAARGSVLVAVLDPPEVEELAVGFIRAGARRAEKEGAEVNRAAQLVAVRLYEILAAGEEAGERATLTMARLYENTGELDRAAKLYEGMIGPERISATALRGLARIAETRGQMPEARAHWQRLLDASRPGDLPWYESQYEVARLTQAVGDAGASCERLEKLRPAMPGLSDAELRGKMDRLYGQVCR